MYEGCMPIEVMAGRGADTMRYGPLRPVGLRDPRTGHRPWANVQLRAENTARTLYNIVGFQTNLKWGEQKRVFSMIPGLEHAEFIRYGVMHRNTFLESPAVLTKGLYLKEHPNVFFAGQITGFEGYMESAASGLLKANPAIRFVGNIEPRDIMAGEVDVIVCDGFVGNVVLKLTEGVAGTLLGMLKDIFMQSIVTKLCYLGVKGGLRNLKHMMDSEEIGGAPLLGAAKPVIKAHGSSKAKGIKNAIRQAKLCVANDLCGTMQSALAEVAAKAAAEKTDAE